MQIITPETTNTRFTRRDWLLIALTFATGAVDAISYFGLGKVFSAFMTGNLVFLGFGIANAGGPSLLPVLFALGSFTLGAYLGARATRSSPANPVMGATIFATMGVVALLEAIFLAAWIAKAGQPTGASANWLIALLALAMGLQMAAVRALGVPGVFTTAATFTLLAFVGDFAGARPAAEAPRLGGSLAGLVAGACTGGVLFIHAPLFVPALPLGVTALTLLAGFLVARMGRETGELAAE